MTARHKLWQRISRRRDAASIATGTHLVRSAQRRRRYQFERLEDRLLMNADDALTRTVTLAANDADVIASDIARPPAAVASVNAASFERFQSTAEFEAWLIDAAVEQWGHLFGQSTSYAYLNWDFGRINFADGLVLNSIALQALPTSNDAAAAGLAFSGTNVQVEGVDEADFVETDGEYLYILSGQDLVIVEAGVGDELRIASRVHFDERPLGMYLSGDRLAIVSSGMSAANYLTPIGGIQLFAADVDYVRYSGPPTTTVTVLDVADRSAPTMVQKSRMDGQLVSSRVVDGELRLVLNNSLNLPPPIARPVESEQTASPNTNKFTLAPVEIDSARSFLTIDVGYPYLGTASVYETLDEYLARVEDEIRKLAMPGLAIVGPDGEVLEERTLVEATDVYRPEHDSVRSMTTIATFDLASNEAGPTDTATIFTAQPSQVYSSANSLYLFSDESDSSATGVWKQMTAVRKFDFDPASHEIALAAKGKFEGTLLNQFAADEHDGYLRVVTTPAWGGGQSLSVLKQMGKRLKVVGSVEGLAPGELIYSVRFMGDRAFLVTFRKVDPLFAIDLSSPTDPQVLGELKIPGYSDYLQPIDDSHLLAVGRGADESSGLFEELQVSIFNIADLTDPQLVDRYSFEGGRSITTPATGDRWRRGDGDHHAVSYFANAETFALPIFNTGDSGWWWSGVDTDSPLEPGQGGLQVFQIDVIAGFTPLGLIQHDTLIERSVQIGEHLFAISAGTLTVHELADPANQLGELSLQPDAGPAAIELAMFVPPEWFAQIGWLKDLNGAGGRAERLLREVGVVASPLTVSRTDGLRGRLPSRAAREAALAAPDELLLPAREQSAVSDVLDGQPTSRWQSATDRALEDAGHRRRSLLGANQGLTIELSPFIAGREA